MTGPEASAFGGKKVDYASREFFNHSQAQRVNTDVVMQEALRKQYPGFEIVVTNAQSSDLLAYAAAGLATAEPLEDPNDPYSKLIKWKGYAAPPRRIGGGGGNMYSQVKYGKFLYKFKDSEFIVYVVNGRDGDAAYPTIVLNYIVTKEPKVVDQLIVAATVWGKELHNEVWVFDQGYWSKSASLYESAMRASWDNVILPEEMKQAIRDDVEGFFDSQKEYENLQVPWKRGLIAYGPPGNGKTISIKAMMHTLYSEKDPIPTLYVRSLTSYAGPEYSISQIFARARLDAPCFLVFEDLDSLVSDDVRSYFLNEVDGLKENDGILMIGSTNHLDQLDDGIAKRPSRFDRKYEFPNPDYEQRVAYAKFWQRKLASNKEIKYPDELCPAVAKITNKFSFAYMQEAYVASLLALARRKKNTQFLRGSGKGRLEDLPLWKEMEKQVALLREGIESATELNGGPGRHAPHTRDLASRAVTSSQAGPSRMPDPDEIVDTCLPEGVHGFNGSMPLSMRFSQGREG